MSEPSSIEIVVDICPACGATGNMLNAEAELAKLRTERDRLLILCGKMRDSFKSIRAWVNTAEPGELEQTIITVRTVSEIALQQANEVLGEVRK